jgi:hypothetical protein
LLGALSLLGKLGIDKTIGAALLALGGVAALVALGSFAKKFLEELALKKYDFPSMKTDREDSKEKKQEETKKEKKNSEGKNAEEKKEENNKKAKEEDIEI